MIRVIEVAARGLDKLLRMVDPDRVVDSLTRIRTLLVGSLALAPLACQTDPLDIAPPASCAVDEQKQWILDTMREVYLWNDQIPEEVDLAAYETPEEVVVALRQGDDRWSRAADKATSDALTMQGKYVGTGMSLARDDRGRMRVAFAHADSPAGRAGIIRGDVIYAVGEKTVAQRDADNDWKGAWGEPEPGTAVMIEVHAGDLADDEVDPTNLRTIELVSDWVQIVTVPHHDVLDVGGHKVGYLLFWTFVGIAYDELDAAFTDFAAAGVDTVVVDLRYNGGGLIAVARYLIDLLAAAEHAGEVAYRVEFNAGFAGENGVEHLKRQPHSVPLDRVIFLTTKKTLSASELVINSVAPWVDVFLVGARTGGKPVGSRYFEFCDKLLQAITFRFTNAAGISDYFDGLPVVCERDDDLDHALGDPAEAMLAGALDLLTGASCAAGGHKAPARPDDLGLAPAAAALFELHHSL